MISKPGRGPGIRMHPNLAYVLKDRNHDVAVEHHRVVMDQVVQAAVLHALHHEHRL